MFIKNQFEKDYFFGWRLTKVSDASGLTLQYSCIGPVYRPCRHSCIYKELSTSAPAGTRFPRTDILHLQVASHM